MPGRTLPQPTADSIREQVSLSVPRILDQAQISVANHQKNLVALYKVQTEAVRYTESVRRGNGIRLIGERIFEQMVLQLLTRVLPIKKGSTQADRVIKFVGGYIKFVNEKAAEEKKAAEEEAEEDDNTTASRFTAALLRFLLRGFVAKDKSIRFRVLQMVAEMVSHLGEIDEDIYKELRAALIERVNDKETPVRVQAVIALSKLCGSEDPSELSEGEQTVSDILIDILAHDSSPEVRRAALLNTPITSFAIPHILDRTRDTDVTVRKLVYSAVLEPNVLQGETTNMGPTHPRALTIAQRELIVQSGLGDREQGVRAAAASLLGSWVDVISKDDTGEDKRAESGVVALLKMFDLVESNVAADVLLSVFVTHADIFENISFKDSYWTDLTPETAFLVRVFVDHCKTNNKDDNALDAALPVVTELAFRIQEAYNDLLEDMQNVEEEQIIRDLTEEERTRLEDIRLDKEFIIGEMLKLAVNLDYSDEIGRRKMFSLVRDMLSQEELPQSLLPKCLDVLRELSASERDLILVCVEIVHELRDPKGEEEEEDLNKDVDAETNFGDTPTTVRPPRTLLFNHKKTEDLSPEEKAHADSIDLRCLSLCAGMLERVNSKFEQNSALDGILGDLIIPAVKRKELAFREKGFIVLGLCCLIAKRLALTSIGLFFTQIPISPEGLKISILQVVFDMLMVHEHDLLRDGNSTNITNHLISLLGSETSEKVQALLCIGISKLVLSGMITDVDVVKNLIIAYLSPETDGNQELRQCLTFFFPVYSYSLPANQRCMREIFVEIFLETNKRRKELAEDEEMISAAQVGALFVDWTDPLKLSKAFDARAKADTENQTDEFIHLDLAGDIFRALLKQDFDKEEKKALCQLLSKLHIPDTVDDDKIRTLKLLMHNLRLRRPLRDTTTNNAFTKFETSVTKKFEKQLEDFDEDEYRKLEQLQELFNFLDEIIPDDDDEEFISLDQPKRKGRKRRSGSIATATTEGEREETPSTSSVRGRSKPKAKRRRLSNSDDESDDDGELGTPPPPTSAPTRSMPKRSAAAKKPAQIITISSDSDEEATPVARKSRSKPKSRVKEEEEEADVDEDIDHLLDENHTAENTFDSIMDDSEEEDEVNDLLVEE